MTKSSRGNDENNSPHRGTSPSMPFHSEQADETPCVFPFLPCPVVLYPVEPDGQPGALRILATVREQNGGRLLLVMHQALRPLVRSMVLGVRAEGGHLFAGIEVLAARPGSNGFWLVEGRFGGLADELLQLKHLTPRFHFDSMTFSFGFPSEVLHRWEELGVLQPVVIDRLLLCPRCHGLPTFRHGCRHCGSGRVSCRSEPFRKSILSDDSCFPVYQCQDCMGFQNELAPIHQCLHCEHRFFAPQGYEMVLRGYHAPRLAVESVLEKT